MNDRADTGRPREFLVPHGASTMSDAEFWSRCDETRRDVDSFRQYGVRRAHFLSGRGRHERTGQ